MKTLTGRNLSPRQGLALVITIILVTSLAILLDIPVLRPVLGILCYAILPGALILVALRLGKIGLAEKLVLSIGVSLATLIGTGLIISLLYYSLGYKTPLSTPSLTFSFGAILIGLCVLAYKTNRNAFSLSMPVLNPDAPSKKLFIIALTFPLLGILGATIMKASGNNLALMFLLFLIPIYIILIVIPERKNPSGLYPFAILMIGISLIFMYSFTSNHITGQDIHLEYFVFQETFASQHVVLNRGYLESCLGITLMPTIFQSLSNISGEYIFKYLFPLIFALTPLCIYYLLVKYFRESVAFLAAFLYIGQTAFYRIVSLRDMLATFFIALAIMVLFSERSKIGHIQKSAIFLSMVAAVIASHYATSFLFTILFVLALLVSWLVVKIFSTRLRYLSAYTCLFSIVGVFLWHSQVWGQPFESGVKYVQSAFIHMGDFFLVESRGTIAQRFITGSTPTLPETIQLYLMYSTIALMAAGIITAIIKYRVTVSETSPHTALNGDLKTKVDLEYLGFAFIGFILLMIQVILPFISQGYNLGRTYMVGLIFLTVLFAIGGQKIAQLVRVKPVVILLAILIPYSMFTSGAAYPLFGVQYAIHLSSSGEQYNRFYVHDQEFVASAWLREQYLKNSNLQVYADHVSKQERLKSVLPYNNSHVLEPEQSEDYLQSLNDSYIYLRYYNITSGKIYDANLGLLDISEYSEIFATKNRIYNNSGSEVYR